MDLQVDAIRCSSPGYCPEGDFPDSTSRLIDAERRQQFLLEGGHYETEYFLTATYRQPGTAERRMGSWVFDGQTRGQQGDAQLALDEFMHTVGSLEERLGSLLGITRLRKYTQTDEFGFETTRDEQLRFMRRCITGIDHPFVRPEI